VLFDGNIGIRGDPDRLLVRVGDLMSPDGSVFRRVETAGARVEFGYVEFEVATGTVGAFPWCWVGCDAIAEIATASGLRVDQCFSVDGRWSARLRHAFDTCRGVTVEITADGRGRGEVRSRTCSTSAE
jgi:hypothetical protein